jgi:excinuclease UvrABC nuclease subunit
MGYDRLIKLSKKIKVESTIELNKFISIEEIENKAEDLRNHLTNKMKMLSEMEDFESAANMKKDVDFIDDKIEFIKELDKPEITTEEYFKVFSMP